MTVAEDRQQTVLDITIEDISTGIFASGYGQVGDGRSFSFHTERILHSERWSLVIEIYRPRLATPVPLAEDVVATASRSLLDIDLTDERSLAAAVRDAVAIAITPAH